MSNQIEIMIEDNTELDIEPENIPLKIVYEDKDIIVVDKPTGMIVHPSPGIINGTLVNALLYHCKDLSGINGVNRPGIVHRIDKETSGLLMIAKNDAAHRSLSNQLKTHSVTRRYVALVLYWISNITHMNPDLMCSSCFKTTLNHTHIFITFYNRKISMLIMIIK